jgi:oligopeptidase B
VVHVAHRDRQGIRNSFARPSSNNCNRECFIDENIEADGHDYFSLGAFEVSNSTQLLAWSSDIDGGEYYTLRIRDIESNTDSPDVIADTAFGGIAWSSNDDWLFYVTPDEQMRPWQVWRHKVGTPVTDDVMVYEDADERFFVGVAASRSGQLIMIESSSKTSSETWILDASKPTGPLLCVAPRRDNIEYTVDHWGTDLAITSNLDAVDFQVMTAPTASPNRVETVPVSRGRRAHHPIRMLFYICRDAAMGKRTASDFSCWSRRNCLTRCSS